MSPLPHIVDMKAAVCTIRTKEKDGQYFGGQGVLLQPDVLLTSWHVVAGAQDIVVTNGRNETARLVRSDLNARDAGLDLAIMELSKPLSRTVAALHTNTDDYLHDMSGYLVTRRTGTAMIHKIGIDKTRLMLDFNEMSGGMRSFATDVQTGPGYSGSPIFDSRGRLCSVLHGGSKLEIGGKLIVPKTGYNCYGVAPSRLAAFIQKTLG